MAAPFHRLDQQWLDLTPRALRFREAEKFLFVLLRGPSALPVTDRNLRCRLFLLRLMPAVRPVPFSFIALCISSADGKSKPPARSVMNSAQTQRKSRGAAPQSPNGYDKVFPQCASSFWEPERPAPISHTCLRARDIRSLAATGTSIARAAFSARKARFPWCR